MGRSTNGSEYSPTSGRHNEAMQEIALLGEVAANHCDRIERCEDTHVVMNRCLADLHRWLHRVELLELPAEPDDPPQRYLY